MVTDPLDCESLENVGPEAASTGGQCKGVEHSNSPGLCHNLIHFDHDWEQSPEHVKILSSLRQRSAVRTTYGSQWIPESGNPGSTLLRTCCHLRNDARLASGDNLNPSLWRPWSNEDELICRSRIMASTTDEDLRA